MIIDSKLFSIVFFLLVTTTPIITRVSRVESYITSYDSWLRRTITEIWGKEHIQEGGGGGGAPSNKNHKNSTAGSQTTQTRTGPNKKKTEKKGKTIHYLERDSS